MDIPKQPSLVEAIAKSEVLHRRIDFVQASCSAAATNSKQVAKLFRKVKSRKERKETAAVEQSLTPLSAVQQFVKWKKIFSVGPGLVNLGATCFMNAALQCLTYCPPLAQFLLQQKHSKRCPLRTKTVGHWCALCELESHVRICFSLEGKRGCIEPSGFARHLRVLCKRMRLGRQEDAHEFTRHLLDAMGIAELKTFSLTEKTAGPLARTTAVHRMFGGLLRSRVKCPSCGHCSDTFDPCMDLSLELGKATSVEDALKIFTRPEKLDKSNTYLCDGCKTKVCATKQLTIHTPPTVLVVHLKRFAFGSGLLGGKKNRKGRRFSFDQQGGGGGRGGRQSHRGRGGKGRGGYKHFHQKMLDFQGMMSGDGGGSGRVFGSKIVRAVKYKERLVLDEFVVKEQLEKHCTAYSLFGVLVHAGSSVHSGHYYSFVKNSTGEWFHMNDQSVRKVGLGQVLQQQHAYMLFYAQTSPILPPGEAPIPIPQQVQPAAVAKPTPAVVKAKAVPTGTASLSAFVKEKSEQFKPSEVKLEEKKEFFSVWKPEAEMEVEEAEVVQVYVVSRRRKRKRPAVKTVTPASAVLDASESESETSDGSETSESESSSDEEDGARMVRPKGRPKQISDGTATMKLFSTPRPAERKSPVVAAGEKRAPFTPSDWPDRLEMKGYFAAARQGDAGRHPGKWGGEVDDDTEGLLQKQQEVLKQQEARERQRKKRKRRDSFDQALDAGKLKKVKDPSRPLLKKNLSHQFDRKQRGEWSDHPPNKKRRT